MVCLSFCNPVVGLLIYSACFLFFSVSRRALHPTKITIAKISKTHNIDSTCPDSSILSCQRFFGLLSGLDLAHNVSMFARFFGGYFRQELDIDFYVVSEPGLQAFADCLFIGNVEAGAGNDLNTSQV